MGPGVCDRVIAVENELQDLLFLFFFFFFDLPNFLSPLKLRHFMIPTWSSTKRVSGGAVKQPPPFFAKFFFRVSDDNKDDDDNDDDEVIAALGQRIIIC